MLIKGQRGPSFLNIAFETVPMFIWFDDDLALSGPFKEDCLALPLSMHLSSRQSMVWCNVLGFVSTGSVSSFSTLQIFWEASHLWGLLCPPVYLLSHFPPLRHVQGSTPTGVFKGGCWPSTHSTQDFPFHFLLQAHCTVTVWGWWHTCVVWQSHLIGPGGCDQIGCTVFMDGSHTLLDSEAPPWQVFGDCAISVHYEVLQFAVFFNEKPDLWLFCLLAILDSAFSSFLAGVSCRDAGISLGTFPTPWFAWALSAGILAVLNPLLDPPKTCPLPVCIPLCLSQLRGVGYGDFVF